ncbi:hypothetical protein IWW38_001119, partial [Coemansia aciculifera]
GGVVEERKDQDIFMTDVVGDQKTKQKMQQTKKLRVDEILGKRSAVAIPVQGTKMGEDKLKRKEHHELRKRLKKIAGFVGKNKVTPQGIKAKPTTGEYDLWTETPREIQPVISQRRVVVSRKKFSHVAELPAVEVAHPGASYRPDAKDHQELVQLAGNEYDEVLRKKQKFSEFSGFRGNNTMDSAMECAQVMIDEIKAGQSVVAEKTEMALDGSDAESDDADMDEGADSDAMDSDAEEQQPGLSTSKDPKRKSRVARNRQRRHNIRVDEEKRAKALVQQSHQLNMTKRLNKDVDEMVERSEQAAERTRKHAEEKARQPRKKVGKHVVPQLLQAVKLAEDLPTSLRQLQPESNGFSEAYNSLVKRNFVEPRPAVHQKRTGRKVRVVEKWSYKDFR